MFNETTFVKIDGFKDPNIKHALINIDEETSGPFLICIFGNYPNEMFRLYFEVTDSNGFFKVYKCNAKEYDFIDFDNVGEISMCVQ